MRNPSIKTPKAWAPSCLDKHQAIKTYGGVEIGPTALSMLIRGIRLAVEAASCPAGYTSGKIYWAQAHTGLEMLEIPEWVCKRIKKR